MFYFACSESKIYESLTFFIRLLAVLLKKTIEPCPKHNKIGLNGYNGNCLGFNGNYNGVYW